jgi:hypothetical protein
VAVLSSDELVQQKEDKKRSDAHGHNQTFEERE